jgi:phage gp16-like protein
MERAAGSGGNHGAWERQEIQDRVMEDVQAPLDRRQLHTMFILLGILS